MKIFVTDKLIEIRFFILSETYILYSSDETSAYNDSISNTLTINCNRNYKFSRYQCLTLTLTALQHFSFLQVD